MQLKLVPDPTFENGNSPSKKWSIDSSQNVANDDDSDTDSDGVIPVTPRPLLLAPMPDVLVRIRSS